MSVAQASPPQKNVVTTPAISTPMQGQFASVLGNADIERPELNALSNLADAAAIITETGSAGDNAGYGEANHSNGDFSSRQGL